MALGDQVQLEMSVLFSDIRDFTTLSESMTPEENFKFINSYLCRMEPAITEYHGFIDKYIGDAIMALFSGEADNAVKAGIAMLRELPQYNQHRANSGYPPIEIGIGINRQLWLETLTGRQQTVNPAVSKGWPFVVKKIGSEPILQRGGNKKAPDRPSFRRVVGIHYYPLPILYSHFTLFSTRPEKPGFLTKNIGFQV